MSMRRGKKPGLKGPSKSRSVANVSTARLTASLMNGCDGDPALIEIAEKYRRESSAARRVLLIGQYKERWLANHAATSPPVSVDTGRVAKAPAQEMGDPIRVTHLKEDLFGNDTVSFVQTAEPTSAAEVSGRGNLSRWVMETIRVATREWLAQSLHTTESAVDAMCRGEVGSLVAEDVVALAALANRGVPLTIVAELMAMQRGLGRPFVERGLDGHAPSTSDQGLSAAIGPGLAQPEQGYGVEGGQAGGAVATECLREATHDMPAAKEVQPQLVCAKARSVAGQRETVAEEMEAVLKDAMSRVGLLPDMWEPFVRHLASKDQPGERIRGTAQLKQATGLGSSEITWREKRVMSALRVPSSADAWPRLRELVECIRHVKLVSIARAEEAWDGLLGGAGIAKAMRLLEALHLIEADAWFVKSVQVTNHEVMWVLGRNGNDRLKLARFLILTARKLQDHAGACSVDDLCAWAGAQFATTPDEVVEFIRGLPGVRWYGEGAWFTAAGGAVVSRPAFHARRIIALAGRPVDCATLAVGLERAVYVAPSNRSEAAMKAKTVPPSAVLIEVLKADPLFVSGEGDSLGLASGFDPLDGMSAHMFAISTVLLGTPGPVSFERISAQMPPSIRKLSDSDLRLLLAKMPFVAEIKPSLYTILGRQLDAVPAHHDLDSVRSGRPRAVRPVGARFEAVVDDPARVANRGALGLRKSKTPEHAYGVYAMGAVQAACWLLGVPGQSQRLGKFDPAFKDALIAGGSSKRLLFDRDARTVRVQDAGVNRGHAAGANPSEDQDHEAE